MKGQFKITLFSFFLVTFLNAQQGSELAFSKSYLYEYESQYSKAIKTLQDLNVDNYQVNLRLGWLFYLNKDYLKSENYYKKAIVHESKSVEARFGLVLPLSAQGNWNNVLSIYGEILKIDPNNSIANYRTASIYYTRKDYTSATSFISTVIKMYPFDFDSNLLYGKILLAQNNTSEAKKYLEKALEYNPQSTETKEIIKKIQP